MPFLMTYCLPRFLFANLEKNTFFCKICPRLHKSTVFTSEIWLENHLEIRIWTIRNTHFKAKSSKIWMNNNISQISNKIIVDFLDFENGIFCIFHTKNMTNTKFYIFYSKNNAFSKLKKSANLLKIWPQIYFIRNIEVLSLKLLFFENFRTRKISQKIRIYIFRCKFMQIFKIGWKII